MSWNPWAALSAGRWLVLVLSAIVTAILSLGVHDMMLTRLNVAYPVHDAVPMWARYIDSSVRLASLVWFCRVAQPSLGRLTQLRSAMTVGVLLVLLNETLRVIAVDIYLTKGWLDQRWVFTLADSLPAALVTFFVGVCATIIARRWPFGKLVGTAGAVLAIAALDLFALKPGLADLAAHFESALHLSRPPELYALPYPFHVYSVIYGMFIEPTIAAFVLVAIIWPHLPGTVLRRVAAFTGLILLIRGRVVTELLFSFWVPERLGAAYLSESQFFLETMVLALLAAITWAWVDRRGQSSSAMSEL